MGGVATSVQHHGKEMSYNNYLDADAAYSAGGVCVGKGGLDRRGCDLLLRLTLQAGRLLGWMVVHLQCGQSTLCVAKQLFGTSWCVGPHRAGKL